MATVIDRGEREAAAGPGSWGGPRRALRRRPLRADAWQLVLPRVLGLLLVLVGLPFSHALAWSGAGFVLLVLLCAAWALWCGVSGWAPARVRQGWAVPLLATAVVSGALLVTLRPDAALAAAVVIMAVMSSGATLSALAGAGVLAAGVLALAIGAGLAAHPGRGLAIAGWSALLVAGHLAGTTRRSMRIRQAQAQELLMQAERVRQEEQRAAALAERTRIAREIHDVLAHSLGALAVQLDVTDSLLTAEPSRAAEAAERVRNARRIAVDGLTETRRAIAALRSDTPPLPEALTALVREHGAAGNAASTLVLRGTPRPLAPEVGLALLRVAQEALANAAKHAPGQAVAAELDYAGEHVRLGLVSGLAAAPAASAADPAAADPAAVAGPLGLEGGYGLAGMRERLLLVGGELTAGPGPGGWRVQAEVPA